jgi:hypothetical protein
MFDDNENVGFGGEEAIGMIDMQTHAAGPTTTRPGH